MAAGQSGRVAGSAQTWVDDTFTAIKANHSSGTASKVTACGLCWCLPAPRAAMKAQKWKQTAARVRACRHLLLAPGTAFNGSQSIGQ